MEPSAPSGWSPRAAGPSPLIVAAPGPHPRPRHRYWSAVSLPRHSHIPGILVWCGFGGLGILTSKNHGSENCGPEVSGFKNCVSDILRPPLLSNGLLGNFAAIQLGNFTRPHIDRGEGEGGGVNEPFFQPAVAFPPISSPEGPISMPLIGALGQGDARGSQRKTLIPDADCNRSFFPARSRRMLGPPPPAVAEKHPGRGL